MMQSPTLHRSALLPAIAGNSGMILMIAAMLLLPVGDTFAKILTGQMHPVAVTMWRLIAQALLLVPVALVMRRRLRGAMFSPVIALSGGLLMVSLGGLVAAFSVLPIATAIAIFFVEPLILTVLAGPLLGERAGPRRMAAVGVGLVGALIVIRPGLSGHGWVTLLPLISAVAYALNMIVLKRASATRSSLTVQCGATIYAALGMILLGGAVSLGGDMSLRPPMGASWALILCAGAAAAASFVAVAEAYRRADASTLAPFQYLEIVMASLLGYLVFGDFPDAFTWTGIAVILASGLYIFHREGQTATRAPRRKRASR